MKKTGLLIGCLLVSGMSLWGQEPKMIETLVVESPRFHSQKQEMKLTSEKQSPINNYLQENIVSPREVEFGKDEGVVIVTFTVEPDGRLSHYEVVNSVSPSVDNSVLTCLEESSGLWEPGKINGSPTAMESKVYVRFDIPGNQTHTEFARDYFYKAMKQYNKGADTEEMNERASTRHYRFALNELENATRFCPKDFSICFWEAKIYEAMGDYNNYQLKFKETKELLGRHNANEAIEMADISLARK